MLIQFLYISNDVGFGYAVYPSNADAFDFMVVEDTISKIPIDIKHFAQLIHGYNIFILLKHLCSPHSATFLLENC
jgi:hypothetical protein